MHRKTLLLALSSLILMLAAGQLPRVGAQNAAPTPVGQLGGPVPIGTQPAVADTRANSATPDRSSPVGLWTIDLGDPPTRHILTLAPNGTMIGIPLAAPEKAQPSGGAWSAGVGQGFSFALVYLQSGQGGSLGLATVTVAGRFSLDVTGMSLAGSYTAVSIDPAGSVIVQEHGELNGKRMAVGTPIP